jgi:shikimate kinase
MKGRAQAVAYGGVSILNAFATGKGAAIGIDLSTRASVILQNGGGEISALAASTSAKSSKLVTTVVEKVLQYYGYEGKLHGEVVTSSSIPTAVGLKSSSAAANAVALATASALDEEPNDDVLVDIGIQASLECGVSLTGAYDDSFVSWYGGAALTDNTRRKVEKRLKIPENIRILILVPNRQTLTGSLDLQKFAPIKRISELAYAEASNGHIWDALTINGLAVSAVLGEDPSPALSSIQAGALGAGLSGKGPAIASVVEEQDAQEVRRAFEKFDGRTIDTKPNFSRASVVT